MRMLNLLRDLIHTEHLEMASEQLIKDCSRITQLRDGRIEVPASNHRIMATGCACLAYAQLQEQDIGIDVKFSSGALKARLEQDGKEFLEPNEFMNVMFEDWRKKLLEDAAGGPEPEQENWMDSLGLVDEIHNEYDQSF